MDGIIAGWELHVARQDHFTNESQKLDYLTRLPRKRMSAAGVLSDRDGRILIVKPSYNIVWHLPGGCVDSRESPRRGAEREVEEEVGLSRHALRLLCVDHKRGTTEPEEAMVFLFDFGTLSDQEVCAIQIDGSEIIQFAFHPGEEAASMLTQPMGRRLKRALAIRNTQLTLYLDDGENPFDEQG